jgi:hypothetical protein
MRRHTVALQELHGRRLSRRVNMSKDDFILIVVAAGVSASDQHVWIRSERVWDRQVLFNCVVCQ